MNSISISKRLALLVLGLLGLLALVVLIALMRLDSSNNTLRSLYDDRMVPVKQLNMVADAYAVGVVDTTHKLRDGSVKPEAAARAIEQAMKSADTQWKAYLATELTKDEQALINKTKPALKTADVAAAKLLELARAGNLEAAARFAGSEMYPAIDPLAADLQELIDLQLTVAESEYKASQAAFKTLLWTSIIVFLITLAVAAVLSLMIVRSITRPLKEAVEIAETVAAGDLRRKIEFSGSDETAQLLGALSKMNQGLVDIVSQVRDCAESITSGSTEIASGSMDLSQRTEEQASSLEETAASMEELTSTVKQNSLTSEEANNLAAQASGVAGKGGQVVQGVVITMGQITDQSKKISDIIGVIDGIAFQTNILALNAAVEAARAGEQGRGFAVVASEVRSLASRSAEAAKEIKTLIGASVERVETGASQVAEAGRTMQDIVSQVQRVSQLLAEISLASREQSQGIDQISDAVMQMDQVTQQNAALVEESAAAAESLKLQAQTLSRVVSLFKL
ncbi:MCP four helix bundle domain-containing protein [Pelomonas sp. V22]|uniref:methyl-accepting chemotaxis protein n=1 Tax=Pelomonas sp. V22 TaxID=2822139 RepID=UPI0024A96883|nr:methyl-accepting chemotaxis protein [Pelomonas sp. V22]MDI4633831.1 MCP four helix bundle domain-containing protein [Pelomonas sp. V22]